MPASAETLKRFDEEERAYWLQRDGLLQQYAGKWVAVVDGQVAASGDQMNKVAAEAWRKTGSSLMYLNLVAKEDVVLRVRQTSQGRYDSSYAPPMPTIAGSVTDLGGSSRSAVTFIVDTGADLTILQSKTADEASLWNSLAGQIRVSGIGVNRKSVGSTMDWS